MSIDFFVGTFLNSLLVDCSKMLDKKAVEEVLQLQKARDLLHEKIEHLENIIINGNPDPDIVFDAKKLS